MIVICEALSFCLPQGCLLSQLKQKTVLPPHCQRSNDVNIYNARSNDTGHVVVGSSEVV